MCEGNEAMDCESVDELDVIDLNEEEVICVSGGPQEANIPP